MKREGSQNLSSPRGPEEPADEPEKTGGAMTKMTMVET
jgi:hypothetical protein